MKTILIIDTGETDTARVILEHLGKRHEMVSTSKVLRSQMLLPLVESMLKEHTLIPSDVQGIQVATGPGSFTGLRVGIAIANTLGYLLDIPVNGKKALVNPTY